MWDNVLGIKHRASIKHSSTMTACFSFGLLYVFYSIYDICHCETDICASLPHKVPVKKIATVLSGHYKLSKVPGTFSIHINYMQKYL